MLSNSSLPADAKLITDDVTRFAAAYRHLPIVQDSARYLDTAYFDRGTPGLRAYAKKFRKDGAELTRVLRTRGASYASVWDLDDRIRAQERTIRSALQKLEAAYPGAVFPPVYFVVGGLGPGGQPGRHGVYIGADTYGAPDSVSIGRGRHLYHTSTLPRLVAHEVVHYNQFVSAPIKYSRQWSNLARAIKEGSADFVAELVSGGHINKAAHVYGLQHEATLWSRFKSDMHTKNTGEWFRRQPADSAQPPDVGYFIGYRIVQSWYEKHQHDPQALARLIRVTDYPEFLEESGYAPVSIAVSR